MAFAIELLPDFIENDEGVRCQLGRMTLGAYSEDFTAPLTYWGPTDYIQQWKIGIARLLGGHSTSCLITALYDPQISNLLFWWPLYRRGRLVHVQNGILLFDQLDVPFEIEEPYRSVPSHRTRTEEGHRISEWIVPIQEIENFLESLQRPR